MTIHPCRKPPVLRVALAFTVALFVFYGPCRAQQQTPPQPQNQTTAPTTSPAGGQPAPQSSTQTPENKPKDDRLFYALPNYLTIENADQAPLLSSGEKYKMVAKTSFDYVEYPYIAALSGISQAENSEAGYGQGAAGYGKRFGAAFADNTIGNFMTGAVFPSILKQDPRYYQLGASHAKPAHRVFYSIERLFVTRTDSGHSQFNVSEIAGNAVAAGISNIYHPASDRTVANTISVWWTEIMWDGVANEAKEFWPDLHQWISRKKGD